MARVLSSMVRYEMFQSRLNPIRRKRDSKASSSLTVSSSHSSMKFCRLIGTSSADFSDVRSPWCGGVNSGSYGKVASPRTP